MALHLVGESLDKSKSHYRASTEQLVQLMRGVYVDVGDDIERTVLAHAVRIARYLYPRAYLSGASAFLLGPTADARLYLSGSRTQRTRLRSLEIVQNKAPTQPAIAPAHVADGLGELSVSVAAPRQRLLEAFRVRSEHAASIDATMREAVAARLIEEHGSAQAASDAVWALARMNGWYREGEAAEKYLLRRSAPMTIVPNAAAFELTVAWHGHPVGRLAHDGFEWRWSSNTPATPLPPVVRQTTPGRLPPFIVSLLPEGWLESVLPDHDERGLLRSGRRYLSNITIAADRNELAAMPQDALQARLADHAIDGLFSGTYAGPGRDVIAHDFEHRLAALYANAQTPRLSGVQIKAPMHLDVDGRLAPSVGLPFTHILKPAGTGAFEALPAVEWMGLALARAAGLPTPDAALVAMPDGMPHALLVERFDIRDHVGDSRLLAMEDLCSVLDVAPQEKYSGTIERAARAVRGLSTAPDDDLLLLLKRVLFAWLIADGDLHLKNMALLKTARPGEPTFRSVRFAPVYDALTTRVFPGLEHDRMALKLNGKDERLKRADFLAVAATAGLRAAQANTAIDDMLQRFDTALDVVHWPRGASTTQATSTAVDKAIELGRMRREDFS